MPSTASPFGSTPGAKGPSGKSSIRSGPQAATTAATAKDAATVAMLPHSRRRPLTAGLLWLFAPITVSFAWFIVMSPHAARALYVWTGLSTTIVVTFFWRSLADRDDIPHAKDVFPRIAMGGIVGAVVGLFAPAPSIQVFLRWGTRAGIAGLLGVAFALGLAGGWGSSLQFLASIGVIVWMLSVAILSGRSVEVAVGWSVLGAALHLGRAMASARNPHRLPSMSPLAVTPRSLPELRRYRVSHPC